MNQPPYGPPPEHFRAMQPAPPMLPAHDPLPGKLLAFGAPGLFFGGSTLLGALYSCASTGYVAGILLAVLATGLVGSIGTAWLSAKRPTWTFARRAAYGTLVAVAAFGYLQLLLGILVVVGSMVYLGLIIGGCVRGPSVGCH